MPATVSPRPAAAPPPTRRGSAPRWAPFGAPEATSVYVATGVLCIHVLDDNFLEPQPGTQAHDHLASGLVPIALLLAFAAIYPRLRAGARGACAIAVGLFGVAM